MYFFFKGGLIFLLVVMINKIVCFVLLHEVHSFVCYVIKTRMALSWSHKEKLSEWKNKPTNWLFE